MSTMIVKCKRCLETADEVEGCDRPYKFSAYCSLALWAIMFQVRAAWAQKGRKIDQVINSNMALLQATHRSEEQPFRVQKYLEELTQAGEVTLQLVEFPQLLATLQEALLIAKPRTLQLFGRWVRTLAIAYHYQGKEMVSKTIASLMEEFAFSKKEKKINAD
ncbi:MAG: hypothetical protein ACE5OZ_10700 [Candidatus Heimdallarchaeota archaeon]